MAPPVNTTSTSPFQEFRRGRLNIVSVFITRAFPPSPQVNGQSKSNGTVLSETFSMFVLKSSLSWSIPSQHPAWPPS